MGYKKYEKNMSFLDMELRKTLGTSRTQRVLKEIHDHIRWEPLKRILLEDYPVGKSPVGNAAYPPVMLLKALLLQKWFGDRSDPELENQINDQVSFKVFIGLPLGDASLDHSVISRFRDRVGAKVMERFHANLLGQLQKKGFSIDAGLAVDARLVSSPMSKDNIEKKSQEREQRKQDKSKEPMKFGRDLESYWTKRKEVPFYGMKEHASIDVKSRLVMCTLLSKASEHDKNYFQYTVTTGIHTKSYRRSSMRIRVIIGKRTVNFCNDMADGMMRKDESAISHVFQR